MAFVGERTAALLGNEPQAATAEVEAELANVRQAWQWATARIEARESPTRQITALAECAQGLAAFYMAKGFTKEGEQAFRRAAAGVRAIIQRHEQQSPPAEELAASLRALSRLLAAQGQFLAALGDNSSALTVLQAANDAAERASALLPGGDPTEQAMLLAALGARYNRTGNYEQAIHHLNIALTLARQVSASKAEIEALTLLAEATSEQGDYATAQRYLDEVLTLVRAHEDHAHQAAALTVLGALAWRWGDLARAEACCAARDEIGLQGGGKSGNEIRRDIDKWTLPSGLTNARAFGASTLNHTAIGSPNSTILPMPAVVWWGHGCAGRPRW